MTAGHVSNASTALKLQWDGPKRRPAPFLLGRLCVSPDLNCPQQPSKPTTAAAARQDDSTSNK
jgi:hypothetical protein